MVESLDILFEDNHCVVVSKPAGRPTTHFSGRESTTDQWVRAYLKEKYGKPGRVFLGIVHRLDKPVSGVLLFARTSKSAARLAEQFRQRTVSKVYWAVVHSSRVALRGTNLPSGDEEFELRDWLRHDNNSARVHIVSRETPGAVTAICRGRVLARNRNEYLLELRPQTGRKHQLRVQLAHRGLPIVGDRQYGSERKFPDGIALHARSLTFLHPIGGEPIHITAEVPPTWSQAFAHLLSAVTFGK